MALLLQFSQPLRQDPCHPPGTSFLIFQSEAQLSLCARNTAHTCVTLHSLGAATNIEPSAIEGRNATLAFEKVDLQWININYTVKDGKKGCTSKKVCAEKWLRDDSHFTNLINLFVPCSYTTCRFVLWAFLFALIKLLIVSIPIDSYMAVWKSEERRNSSHYGTIRLVPSTCGNKRDKIIVTSHNLNNLLILF